MSRNWNLNSRHQPRFDSLLIAKHEAANDNSEGEDTEEFDDVYLIQTVSDIFFGNTCRQFIAVFFLRNFNEI